MRRKLIKVLAVLLLVGFLVYLFYSPQLEFDVLENPNRTNHQQPEKPKNVNQNDGQNPQLETGVGTYIGKSLNQITSQFGTPDRIYSSQHGYHQYIYHGDNRYMIFSLKKDKVKSVYVTGEGTEKLSGPIKINAKATDLFDKFSINTEPQFKVNGQTYHYELSDKDVKTQALIQFDDTFAQVFIDQQKNKVLGLRYLDKEALADMDPYAQNDGEETPQPTEKSTEADVRPPDQNVNERLTLYELTNEMRKLNERQPLKVNDTLENVATVDLFNYSNQKNTEFTEENLLNLMKQTPLNYKSVSQNVGYNFNDVPTLVHSWINSDIHRSRMLNSKYVEMGGEVQRQYYMLIFLEKGENA
ncbi:CAP-associated domain-containing protein [Staphylococcus intermedius]|uniref:V5/Tpx-1 related allergen n=1 Tax=Staphylococcus intermedius NCTC 11048 TaxID=1141106 RepID=A0A380G9M0_STAIN|nr:CAP-associated domain-containing protein [Staphylococcus intermedius]PCF65198.1 SCP-like extracellular protein [Staphylococcus intermedius]PCF80809.1 SCP-like extracellular protein [Staphylococcus intermedius]PCF82158.1 SCP-like extracellular protein [Staphylococcus intermedius]PCF88494.1 SCP-like extracellular protein [Staphylococcus intermedius]PCF89209.1 SCP-like extracellular protein [Staphylococcus intermedius]